ncbi:MAG: DUF4476 domain-containing protein [Myxococcales bacterium]|nr:DUF4476 domain-containing protein [Myxococcales bacterium]
MRRLALAAVLIAVPAFAQGIKLEMNVNTSESRAESRAESSSFSNEAYKLSYDSSSDGRTLMKVLEPEGARCDVWDGNRKATFEVPFSFDAAPDRFYKFVVYLPNGQVFEKKLEAKARQVGKLYVQGGGSATVMVRVDGPAHAPPPPPPPAGPVPMGEGDFSALVGAVQAEDFSGEKLDVIRTASSRAYFTVDQVGRLVDLMDFGNDKVQVVEITRAKIVDRQNAFQLYQHFEFAGEKQQVKRLLGN